MARLASLYDRQADAPDQALGVVPQGILLLPVPDFENNDLRGPVGTVPGRANFAYLDPLFAGYLEPFIGYEENTSNSRWSYNYRLNVFFKTVYILIPCPLKGSD